jgi:hypothetical protein
VVAAQVALDAAKARKAAPVAASTGKGDHELQAALAANKILSARVGKIEDNARSVEFKNEIAAGVRAGKITPAQAANAEWLSIFDGSPSKVRKHVAASVAIVSGDAKAPGALPDANSEDLTADELSMCVSLGQDPALVKKHILKARASLARTKEQELSHDRTRRAA